MYLMMDDHNSHLDLGLGGFVVFSFFSTCILALRVSWDSEWWVRTCKMWYGMAWSYGIGLILVLVWWEEQAGNFLVSISNLIIERNASQL